MKVVSNELLVDSPPGRGLNSMVYDNDRMFGGVDESRDLITRGSS